jgi:uncharacterized membrane protein YfcA
LHVTLDPWRLALAFVAAFIAGAINSVAGGGTLVSFPTLIWLGLDSITANATNTVSVWPGAVASVWAYRRELRTAEARFRILMIPSLVGGLLGAILLRVTPAPTFDRMVPFLILFATLLFMVQATVQRILKTTEPHSFRSHRWLTGAMLFQFGVGVYGGYFGAGIGILTLAALGVLGLTNIHEMNSLKTVFGGTINGIAAIYFIWERMVYWPVAVVTIAGAIAGGYGGAGMARRLGQRTVRTIVICIGLGMAVSLFIRK